MREKISIKNIKNKAIQIVIILFLVILWQSLEQTTWLKTINNVFYDSLIRSNVLNHKIREDIVIIAIDDKSIEKIGRWPWSRSYHAQLLRSLKSAKSVAFDLLFTENSNNDDDNLLNKEIINHQKVVLPFFLQSELLTIQKPIYESSFTAHIHPEIDDDGVVRSVFLQEGINNQTAEKFWQLMPSLLLASHLFSSSQLLEENIAKLTQVHPQKVISNTEKTWQRRHLLHIAYVGKPNSVQTVSYIDVINGTIEPHFFTDKYVLIGATATGLGDSYPTPVSGESRAMAGIEIHANVLHSLLNKQSIKIPINEGFWHELTLFRYLGIFWLIIASILILRSYMTTKQVILGLLILIISSLLTTIFLWRYGYFWSCLPITIILFLVYPLWAWFNLYQTISYLTQEADELTLENKLQPVIPELIENIENIKNTEFSEYSENSYINDYAPIKTYTNAIEHKTKNLHRLIQQVKDMREFVSNSLNHLPDACLVINGNDVIISGNEQAEKLFEYWTFSGRLSGVKADFLKSLFNPPLNLNLQEFMTLNQSTNSHFYTQGLEKDWQINRSICYDANKRAVGMIFNFNNITLLKQAERERNDTLRFLSHDLRSPQSIILTLLEMQEADYEALGEPFPNYLNNIKKQARKTIDLAEDFVQLAKAEAQIYTLKTCVINWITHETIDEYYSLALKKGIKFNNLLPIEELCILGEENLLRRAIGNLISNAIKYSPDNTIIEISCNIINSEQHETKKTIHLKIKDQGYGMTQEQTRKIFQKFQRFHADKAEGVGLGMPFVKTVIDKHDAVIICDSIVGQGTVFTLVFDYFSDSH